MNVLMITGDKRFGPGNSRYELQKSAVDRLDVVCWPRGNSLWHIFAMARRGHYDVITTQDPFWRAHLGHHLKQFFGGKLNVQVHADLDMQPWHRRLMARYHLRRADSVRVVSEKIKRQVESFGIRAPITLLPIFLDIEDFKKIKRVPHAQKTVLWVGRFEEEKDPLAALRVFKEVHKEVDARFLMLGRGSLAEELKAVSSQLDLSVEFPGWVDPKLYLAQADVVLCTSPEESWGASIIEALAAGVAVVAPDVGIAREAGASVVPRGELAQKVIEVLRSGAAGMLTVTLPGAPEWARRWRESLT